MSDITYMTAVMLSALNGAKIEMRVRRTLKRQWYPVDNPSWNWDMHDYRVAQENSDED